MSFYTALTGLNGSQADIAATSNNIANVGTTGFKRSRAEFGDIFATSPLQNASSSIGSGSILKGVKQQFTQGNIASSLNALDLAISGQGFFALKPSLTSGQVVYTRNGSFNVDNNRNVVDSTGQFLLTYPVNDDGSVTSKSISDAVPLQLPVTSGDPKATGNISLGVNLPADAPVVTDNPKFADGYQFSTNDPESFTNSTSLTIFDDLGNPTIATVYFIKTQAATASDPTNKYETRLVIDETVIDPDLVASVNDNGEQIYIDRFGRETTIDNIADDNYFAEGKGSPLYRRDDLNQVIPSQPARLTGSQSSFDFGEEGNKLIEITNDPMRFKATREAGNNDASIFWGKDFLLVNVDDGDVPVSVDLRPGFYNATQLADEVERAINDAYGDDNKLQIRSNVDDKLTVDFSILNTSDGTLKGLAQPVEIDLLQPSYVSGQLGIDTTGSSPDFTREEFLAHAQVRIIDAMNQYEANSATTGALGVNNQLFTRSSGAQMDGPYEKTDVLSFDYRSMTTNGGETIGKTGSEVKKHLVYSFYDKNPTLEVFDNKVEVATGGNITYDAPNNILSVDLPSGTDMDSYTSGEVVRLAGNFDSYDALINGRSLTILEVDKTNYRLRISTTGEGFPDSSFELAQTAGVTNELNFSEAYILSNPSTDVEAFFEGEHLTPAGAVNSYNNKKIVLRETAASTHSYKHNDTDLDSVDIDAAGFKADPVVNSAAIASGANGFVGSVANVSGSSGTVTVTGAITAAGNVTVTVDGNAYTAALTLPVSSTALPASGGATAFVGDGSTPGTLTVTTKPSASGNVDVTIDGTKYTVAINSTNWGAETTTTTAAKVAAALNALSGNAAVPFTVTSAGANITIAHTAASTATQLAAKLNAITAFDGRIEAFDNGGGVVSFVGEGEGYKEWYITTVGDTDWTMANSNGTTNYSAGNGLGKDIGGVGLQSAVEGTMFKADGSTNLTGTGRVKQVYDNHTLVTDQKYLVVAGSGSHDIDNDGVSEAVATNQYITVKSPVATGLTSSATGGAEGVAGNASDATLTITAAATTNGDVDVVVDGVTYTVSLTAAATPGLAETATQIATQLALDTDFNRKYAVADNSGVLTLSPKSVQLPAGIKVIEISETFSNLTSEALGGTSSLSDLGLAGSDFANSTVWVDEKNPPVKITYDAVNQRFEFGVNHTAIGPGTDSNFRAFKIYGSGDADGTNNIGIPAPDAAVSTAISSTAKISAEPFVADGGELQINAKRFGVQVDYNSDVKTFTFSSGTTGEDIPADGALGVNEDQKASNIQVGRYALDASDGSVVNASFDTATRYMGAGDNGLMGVGASKNDVSFKAARGLASEPARAVGASATEPLSEVFALSATAGDNVFNVSVNGISGIIEVPGGNYVGSTLAEALQTRINQISDATTGAVVGGVTVQYQADSNNFVFTTGTAGSDSTIKVKGAAKLGLDDVPLGVGSVPEIVNLVQATNAAGVPLFVNELGQVVETPPDNLVDDYFPLYIDEGELTFDKTGQIISPLNMVHYEQQAAGFSISLDVDYSASTQLSQPFSVNNLDQDGFTSGRLDGLDIDSTGLLRANYTNGENKPLGKIVLANFNNQNGLKQIGNATFVETASSGTPTFGEAGAEGFGAIQSGSLERSNVDITEELVNLITAQRNFQASSKAIETSTQLTQAIINIRS